VIKKQSWQQKTLSLTVFKVEASQTIKAQKSKVNMTSLSTHMRCTVYSMKDCLFSLQKYRNFFLVITLMFQMYTLSFYLINRNKWHWFFIVSVFRIYFH